MQRERFESHTSVESVEGGQWYPHDESQVTETGMIGRYVRHLHFEGDVTATEIYELSKDGFVFASVKSVWRGGFSGIPLVQFHSRVRKRGFNGVIESIGEDSGLTRVRLKYTVSPLLFAMERSTQRKAS